jgi:hypothetical protein
MSANQSPRMLFINREDLLENLGGDRELLLVLHGHFQYRD